MTYKVGDKVRIRYFKDGNTECFATVTVVDVASISTRFSNEGTFYLTDNDDVVFIKPENILGLDIVEHMKRGKNV